MGKHAATTQHATTQQQLTSTTTATTRSMLQVLVACMSQPFGVI